MGNGMGNGMGMEQEHTWELFDTYYVGQNGTTGLKYVIADFYSVFILSDSCFFTRCLLIFFYGYELKHYELRNACPTDLDISRIYYVCLHFM